MAESLASSQFEDSLAIPRMVPRMMVRTMPIKETSRVFRKPTKRARAVGVGGGILDEFYTDFEGGLFIEKTEAGGNVLPCKVGQGVVYQIIAEESDTKQGENLVKNRQFGRITQEGNFLWCCRIHIHL